MPAEVDEGTPEGSRSEVEQEVLDLLKSGGAAGELFPEMADDLRGRLFAAAQRHLPDWQFKAFRLWLNGSNRSRIAASLGLSRATVRCALDGGGSRNQPGALAAIASADASFRKELVTMAEKNIAKEAKRIDTRLLSWFAGINNKPDLIAPLALLLVVDALSDKKGEVPVADLLPHFPRSAITPSLTLLRAFGYASCDGRVVKIHSRPEAKA